eukprot:251757-Amphidinium_carterae.1
MGGSVDTIADIFKASSRPPRRSQRVRARSVQVWVMRVELSLQRLSQSNKALLMICFLMSFHSSCTIICEPSTGLHTRIPRSLRAARDKRA